MNADQPLRPANIANIVAINQGKRPFTLTPPAPRPLTVDEFIAARDGGATVIDARSEAEFGEGFVPGSINVQLASTEFEQRVGWLTDPEAPLLLVASNSGAADAALQKLAFVGIDSRVVGYLRDGVAGWSLADHDLSSIGSVSVETLGQTRVEEPTTQILDVREAGEYAAGRIPGAFGLSFKRFDTHLDELDLDRSRPVHAICKTGMRSSTACSLLRRRGFDLPVNVLGGMKAWEEAGLPVEPAS